MRPLYAVLFLSLTASAGEIKKSQLIRIDQKIEMSKKKQTQLLQAGVLREKIDQDGRYCKLKAWKKRPEVTYARRLDHAFVINRVTRRGQVTWLDLSRSFYDPVLDIYLKNVESEIVCTLKKGEALTEARFGAIVGSYLSVLNKAK